MPTGIFSADHSRDSHRIRLAAIGAPTLDVPVRFADEAPKALSMYRDSYGLGASEMEPECGNIYDFENNLIGHISYNGRIWDGQSNPVE